MNALEWLSEEASESIPPVAVVYGDEPFLKRLALKRLATEWFHAHQATGIKALAGVTPRWLDATFAGVASSAMADAQVGYYGAVQNLARLPYQAIIAVTFVIFPMVPWRRPRTSKLSCDASDMNSNLLKSSW